MRLRFKPYAGPELAACDFHVHEPLSMKGGWHESFAKKQPLHLELGCGKGGFLAQLALQNPNINYVGIDLTDKVLILTKRNIETLYAAQNRTVDNVKILTHDIERIGSILDEKDVVQRIYINFCNPWNKKAGHTKHRLTHSRQLAQYRNFLADDGEIWFKCDDENLYDDTLQYLKESGFAVTWQTRDLHADEPAWNIRTEHEEMYHNLGVTTKACIARIIKT